MKDFTPEGCTRTPKCASVPSQSVYSFAPGFAAVTAFAESRNRRLFGDEADHTNPVGSYRAGTENAEIANKGGAKSLL